MSWDFKKMISMQFGCTYAKKIMLASNIEGHIMYDKIELLIWSKWSEFCATMYHALFRIKIKPMRIIYSFARSTSFKGASYATCDKLPK